MNRFPMWLNDKEVTIEVTHYYQGRPVQPLGLPETWAPAEPSEIEFKVLDEADNELTMSLENSDVAEVERAYINHCDSMRDCP